MHRLHCRPSVVRIRSGCRTLQNERQWHWEQNAFWLQAVIKCWSHQFKSTWLSVFFTCMRMELCEFLQSRCIVLQLNLASVMIHAHSKPWVRRLLLHARESHKQICICRYTCTYMCTNIRTHMHTHKKNPYICTLSQKTDHCNIAYKSI